MKKLLTIIALVILTTISAHSQTFSVLATFNQIDSTLTIRTNAFILKHPVKVRFNDFNGVLINETHMDSINLKYLKSSLLFSQKQSLENKVELQQKQLNLNKLTIDYLEDDNLSLKTLSTNKDRYIENQKTVHENETLYWKEKAKGKFRSFLFGTAAGAVIVVILTSTL